MRALGHVRNADFLINVLSCFFCFGTEGEGAVGRAGRMRNGGGWEWGKAGHLEEAVDAASSPQGGSSEQGVTGLNAGGGSCRLFKY